MKILKVSIFWLVILASCDSSINVSSPSYTGKVDSILELMTLEEKVGQMTLYTSGWDVTGPTLNENYKQDIIAGRCGNVFNAHTVKYNRELQRMAVEESRLGIPLLFGYDVIHGHKTIFPIPLAEACSWDLELIQEAARLSAKEAAASGLNWTFNPMVDIARDPRWGRIAEGSGEDPYLGSKIAEVKVKGYQGEDLSDPFTLMACVKHFAAYGAAQAGRDYHTVDLSKRTLFETYLPPFKAAIDAGAATLMTSFNEINGIPSSGNEWLLNDLLKKQWGFDGFVVTDYTSINEMVPHGFSKDLKQAAYHAAIAGVDMDMQGGAFQAHLTDLVEEGKVDIAQINDAVRRILMKKFELGLFDDPYRYLDEAREAKVVESAEIRDHALRTAQNSIVLLKNESFNGNKLLPISREPKSIAIVGPLGDNRVDLLGSWHASGDSNKVETIKEVMERTFPSSTVLYAEGCKTTGDDRSRMREAVRVASQADFVVMTIGENYLQSGEAASRSNIKLPGIQEELVKAIVSTGKPVIAVVMAGRPLDLSWIDENVPAVINGWHLGTMSSQAIVNVLTGKVNPSGKLVSTFPRNVGQIPIYYSMKNTGRPFDADNKYTSKYLDVDNTPLYPFGYGLSYTSFEYGEPVISADKIKIGDSINVKVEVTNTGEFSGKEVVQLYIQDLFADVTRPVKELKRFQKVSLEPGESKEVEFTLVEDDLAYYHQNWDWKVDAGKYSIYVGGNSRDVKSASFELIN